MKKGKNGYLEETTTTMTTLEDKWKSKQRERRNSENGGKNGGTPKQYVETDFDCQEPLPPSGDFTPGSKPPLKRNIPPLVHKSQYDWNRQISSPLDSDQDRFVQPHSITLPNLIIDSPKTDDSIPSGGSDPRQNKKSKYLDEETKVTTTTETTDTYRWKRRPKRRTKSVSFETIQKKQFQDKPLNAEVPNKTLQQAAFEMLQLNQAEVWRKSWKAQPVVYTRGVYKPQQPLYKRDAVGENNPNESLMGRAFEQSQNDSARMESPERNTFEYAGAREDDETHFTDNESVTDDTNLDVDENRRYENKLANNNSFPANPGAYSKSYSPFIYNSITRKVTYVKPLKRRRQYNSLSLYPIRGATSMNLSTDLPPNVTEPGPVDFTKYGYLSKLWMESVDMKTVQKSNTMYLSVLPAGEGALDGLENTILKRYIQRTGRSADELKDSKDGSQWVIARGRSVRIAKRKWMEQKENYLTVEGADKSFNEGSPSRSPINHSFANHPSSMLFFKVDQINWPDLAWILFDGIQSDAETVRTIADVKLKHQDDAGAQIRDLMARWWLKKGDSATIEELQNALEFVQIPYVHEEDENASFFYPAKGGDDHDPDVPDQDHLMIEEVSENDPEISRLMVEYDHNASYAAPADALQHQTRDYDSSRPPSGSHLQVPSMRDSRQSLGSAFRDKFRLSTSSLQRSQSNIPSRQAGLATDSSLNVGSQSSFRNITGGWFSREAQRRSTTNEPIMEMSSTDEGHKESSRVKHQASSYDLESNL